MVPRKYQGLETVELAEVLDDDSMQRNELVATTFIISVTSDGRAFFEINILSSQRQWLADAPAGHVIEDQQCLPPI